MRVCVRVWILSKLSLFLVGACSGFCSLDLAFVSCQLFSDVMLGASVLPEPVGSAHIVVVWLLQMN